MGSGAKLSRTQSTKKEGPFEFSVDFCVFKSFIGAK